MQYKMPNYYTCFDCGRGTFYVDLSAPIYGIYPCTYWYVCDNCGRRKTMACKEEAEMCVRQENKNYARSI